MQQKLARLREKARQLPTDPGVYIMRDAAGQIIYIGKAKALRTRVSSYFRSIEKHTEKTLRMVERAEDFETIVTASEFEALVLECSMIKQYRPKYNILLKDDKGYHYVRISGGDWPRITAEKQIDRSDGARYLGPYTSSFVVNQTVDEVGRAFLLPSCKRKFPEDIGKGRPCLNYHIKQCVGVCSGRVSRREYKELIDQALELISGGSGQTIQSLTARMERAAEAMDFEKAAFLRDRIRAIERMQEHQNVVFTKAKDEDVVAIVQNEQLSCAVILKIRGQRLVDKQAFQLGEIETLAGARADFLLRFYQGGEEIPKTVLLDGEVEDHPLVEQYLGEQAGRKVQLHVPERGEGLRLVQMASANAAQQIAHKVERTGRELAALDELARLLGLDKPPVYIEAYDISNYGSQTMLGGMVVFENGRPQKRAYKKFNIKTVEGTDDYASMREVLSRRFARYFEEKDGDGEGFGRLPDLILLDGGKGHVSAVQPLLDEMGLSIPLFGMVKDSAHRTRAIAQGGGEIAIAKSRSAFALVTKIQDEVHRFSITAMKQRHQKTGFALQLTECPGVGEKRARALLRHFKTQKALREAAPEMIAQCPGMSLASAQRLHAWLHPCQEEEGLENPG